MGCSACQSSALALARLKALSLKAMCQVEGLASLQSSCLRLHAQSNIHKAAIIAYYSPTSSPLKLLAESTLDNKLLAGHVPQLPDMVRLWSWITNPVSFKTMSSLSLTETFLQQSRQDNWLLRCCQLTFDTLFLKYFMSIVLHTHWQILLGCYTESSFLNGQSHGRSGEGSQGGSLEAVSQHNAHV